MSDTDDTCDDMTAVGYQVTSRPDEALRNLKAARIALELARIDVVQAWIAFTHDAEREAFWNRCVSVDPNCRDIINEEEMAVIADWYAVCDIGQPGDPPGIVHAIFRNHADAVDFHRDLVSMTSPSSATIETFRFQGVIRVE